MNDAFPPLSLAIPLFAKRRREKNPFPKLPQEIIAQRKAISKALLERIEPISQHLQSLGSNGKNELFFKIESSGPINLSGTGLKQISEYGKNFTLVVPKENNLAKLQKKISQFGEGLEQKGHIPHEGLVSPMTNFSIGDPKDRISEDLFDNYEKLIKQASIIIEIEMLSLKTGKKKCRKALDQIRNEVEGAFKSGLRGNYFEHEEGKGIRRAVIRCTGELFKELVELPFWRLRIIRFDSKPKFETYSTMLSEFSIESMGEFEGPKEDAPIICVIDSGVTKKNPFLDIVSLPELLKSFLKKDSENSADSVGHGSAVASLAAYYALNIKNGEKNIGKLWIASAKVLNEENAPEDERLLSLVIEDVISFFVPKGVRIFTFSINAVNRRWNDESKRTVSRNSWLARKIDQLIYEWDVVIFVSTGNIAPSEVRYYYSNKVEYPFYQLEAASRIQDPAQAALAITVGGLALNTLATGNVGTARAIAERYQPSPFTRMGPGINGEIKPDLVDFAGNYLHDTDSDIIRANPGTNIVVANNVVSPAISTSFGTSLAVPRAAHRMAMIFQDLVAMGIKRPSANLLKAFLINSCTEPSESEYMNWRSKISKVNTTFPHHIAGHGVASEIRATLCDDYSVVAYFEGWLQTEQVYYFDIPVPIELAHSTSGSKRLSVTVVYSPEVQKWGLDRYLGTTMRWRIFKGKVSREKVTEAMSIEEDEDNVTAERPEEMANGAVGIRLRSKGTIQHDVFVWNHHAEENSIHNYTLAISTTERWHRKKFPKVKYAVVVRLEDTTRSVPIYSRVKLKIEELIKSRVKIRF